MTSRDPADVLRDAQAHLDLVREYAATGLDDQLTIDAICMRLSAAVESLSTLDPVMRDRVFGETWALMWGMRNRIVHGYLLVNADIVRETVQRDVPRLESAIEAAVQRSG